MKNIFGQDIDLDLGDDHTLHFAHYGGEVSGANIYHVRTDGRQCAGWITFAGRAWARAFSPRQIPVWEVITERPLTLTPSILCKTCGDHGFIEKSKWRRA